MSDPTTEVKLETALKVYTSMQQIYYSAATVALLVAEAYEKALAAGWETKALDPLLKVLRDESNANN